MTTTEEDQHGDEEKPMVARFQKLVRQLNRLGWLDPKKAHCLQAIAPAPLLKFPLVQTLRERL